MYEKLKLECKRIAENRIFDSSVLKGDILKSEEKNFILKNWNAFLVGLIADQSVKVDVAWRLPYQLNCRLGHFDLSRLIDEETIDSLERIIKSKPSLHRYPRKMAEYIYLASLEIVKKYNGKIENLWKTNSNSQKDKVMISNIKSFL